MADPVYTRQMKVVLYHIIYSNFFSVLCSLVTGSSYSHSAVILDDGLYDTDFSPGFFGKVVALPQDEADRLVTVFTIPLTEEQYQTVYDVTQGLRDVDYDTWGLFLWPFGFHDKSKMYCFEATDAQLAAVDKEIRPPKNPISGRDIFNELRDQGYKAEIGFSCDLLPVEWGDARIVKK